MKLEKALFALPEDATLVFCDEGAEIASPLDALKTVPKQGSVAVLIGPEDRIRAHRRGQRRAEAGTADGGDRGDQDFMKANFIRKAGKQEVGHKFIAERFLPVFRLS